MTFSADARPLAEALVPLCGIRKRWKKHDSDSLPRPGQSLHHCAVNTQHCQAQPNSGHSPNFGGLPSYLQKMQKLQFSKSGRVRTANA